jgi:hypothetical protein
VSTSLSSPSPSDSCHKPLKGEKCCWTQMW